MLTHPQYVELTEKMIVSVRPLIVAAHPVAKDANGTANTTDLFARSQAMSSFLREVRTGDALADWLISPIGSRELSAVTGEAVPDGYEARLQWVRGHLWGKGEPSDTATG